MGFNCGIVGLPNVGKSTIFNALTSCTVEASNYPFCTIEPNSGVVAVPDARIQVLAEIAKSQKLIPTTIEFVDIAGLVKGASTGEGLGNQFLGHIRSCDAIVHVVRCFEDENITHVDGSVSPVRDAETIETELLLSDLSSVEKRLERTKRAAKSGDKALKAEADALELAGKCLEQGVMLRTLPSDQLEIVRGLDLLTSKPMMYVANVCEEDVTILPENAASGSLLHELREYSGKQNAPLVVISGRVESEIAQLSSDDRVEFLEALGLQSSGLERLALAGHNLLNLITFFTVGPKEARAWTCTQQTLAPDAAGIIHTDFAKGFIRAEVISYNHFVEAKGESGARDKGVLRIEGRNYIMQDGDVVHFRFNV